MKHIKTLSIIVSASAVCLLSLSAHAADMKIIHIPSESHTLSATGNVSYEKNVRVIRSGPTYAQRHAIQTQRLAQHKAALAQKQQRVQAAQQQLALQNAYNEGFKKGVTQTQEAFKVQPHRHRTKRDHRRRYSTSFALPRFRHGSFGRTITYGRGYGRRHTQY